METAEITDIRQYLTFKLWDEIFAVDVAQVREILEVATITKVPKTPEFMRGVINVRGSVVPVVDMRLKFAMPGAEETINTCIVVMEVSLDTETTVIGALVDSVQEVSEFAPDQIEPTPSLGTHMNVKFIKGIGKQDEEFVMILDIDKIFSTEELASVQDVGTGAMVEKASKEPEEAVVG